MDKNTHEKNYENDIYLMIPLADNQKNWRLDELGILQQATQDQQDDYSRIPDNFSRRLLCSLQAYLEFLFTLQMIIQKRDKNRKLSALPLAR